MICPICDKEVAKHGGYYYHVVEGTCREPYTAQDMQRVYAVIEKLESRLNKSHPVLDAARRVERYDWSLPDIVAALGEPACDDINDLCKSVREIEKSTKPYEFTCLGCGRKVVRHTDCKVKVCSCGTKNIFK